MIWILEVIQNIADFRTSISTRFEVLCVMSAFVANIQCYTEVRYEEASMRLKVSRTFILMKLYIWKGYNIYCVGFVVSTLVLDIQGFSVSISNGISRK